MSRSQVVVEASVNWLRQWTGAWNAFWFLPRLPHTLAIMRIAVGAMLLYTHVVLATDLMSFVGPDAWMDPETIGELHRGGIVPQNADWGRSYLWHIDSPGLLWAHHALTMLVSAMVMVGFATRLSTPLAWGLQLMYMHRLTGALFGLDQIVTMLLMYLMLSRCGSVFAVDAWLRRRRPDWAATNWGQRLLPSAQPATANMIATRLIQLHLCTIYLFGGLWKARGESWWDGSALWFSAANLEYQSVDVTWFVARYPFLCSALSHVTVFWETFYCALVWPRLTRPLILLMAVMVHGGIALFLGMITFGTIMIVANLVFLSPCFVRRLVGRE